MIFLIEYNRKKGCIVTYREFDDSQRQEAEASRLEMELDLNRREMVMDHEVVLLEADDIEALKKTHGRYFFSLKELLQNGLERECVK